jgi:lipid-A-disaccharide synthase
MKDSQFGIVKAGTSTLEAALLELPFCTIYKTSTTSYLLGKYLININFLSMPNILLDKNVVEEFIQTDATPSKLSSMLNKFENDNNYVNQMKNDFSKIRNMLGTESACQQSASIINSEFLQ